ncbi:Fungal pheromone mating factor STE2 GPCR [Penicillium odoratum]|uniref:Fungal pheromone mating factor STE2 GPCR n=1 Tax=Penicillium odoratum TaxID=1167516 RepID=UPI002548A036|nr:Fungal pheromone mating factor STE2 GPCR [Penicillium odoratum]KAJ5769490.1 Fungal pheromone mating factor STE2 GPCR [Penicillium odoratum]
MASWNPEQQNVTFLGKDKQPITISLPSLDQFFQYNIKRCIDYGSQLGATVVLFVIMVLLTRRDKRRSVIFILNSLALIFNFLRLLFQANYYTTGFERVYAFVSGDYSEVETSAYALSVVAVIFESLTVICFECSLVFQVHVICATLRRRHRQILFVFSIVMALVPIGFRAGWMVMNCIEIVNVSSFADIHWLESATTIVITISICFFCTVFVTKLGFAIRQRRRLGVRDFGPMKAIFICGCQTLIVPTICTIIQYFVLLPGLSSMVFTLVTISLPLSSLWAGATLEPRRGDSVTPQNRNLWQALAFYGKSPTQSKQTATEMTGSTVGQTLCYGNPIRSKYSESSDAPLGICVEHDISISSMHQSDSPV